MPFAVQAWETWLSEHLVQAMVNYPEAVMLGNINVIVTTFFIVVTIVLFLSLIIINIVVCRILFPLLIMFIILFPLLFIFKILFLITIVPHLDIGSNIGPHSLTVAAMGREVSVFFINTPPKIFARWWYSTRSSTTLLSSYKVTSGLEKGR